MICFAGNCIYTSPAMPFCKGWMCKTECWTEAKLIGATVSGRQCMKGGFHGWCSCYLCKNQLGSLQFSNGRRYHQKTNKSIGVMPFGSLVLVIQDNNYVFRVVSVCIGMLQLGQHNCIEIFVTIAILPPFFIYDPGHWKSKLIKTTKAV